ncbi:MAG: FG-GAP repeat domain-containing protein [Planctomycetaceae bacterium]
MNAKGQLLVRAGLSGGGFGTAAVAGVPSAVSEFLVLPPPSSLIAERALVVALARSGSEVFLGTLDANGGWTDRGRVPLPLSGEATRPLVSTLRSGDFDGDGLTDLAVLDLLANRVQLLIQQPNGSFALGATGPVGFAPTAVFVTELNGQPGDDFVVTNRVSGDASVFVTDTSGGLNLVGRFQATSLLHAVALDETNTLQVQTLDRIGAAAIGDFDEDGALDLIIAADNSLSASLVLGGPGGTFFDPSGELAVRLPASASVIRTNDLNGDQHLDLVLLLRDAGSVAVALGNGDGTFGVADVRSAGFEPKDITLADADGDEILDILVGNDFGDLLILKGNGDGTFQDFVDSLRDQENVPLAVADLDGDGKQEVILANQAQNRLLVQDVSTRESSLIANSNIPLLAPGAVQLADLNDDQVLELIVANSGGNQVLVYSQQPDGSFGIPQKFAVGTNPTGITIQDVNGDQLPDLVVANRGSNDVSILLNQAASNPTLARSGSANFTFIPGPRLNTGAGSGPVSTAVRDANQDGQLDVVVTSADSGTVSLLPGVGGGFFNDVNPATLNIGSTGIQGGIIAGGSFFAANPTSNSFTFIRDLDASFRSGGGIDHFDSQGESPGYLIVHDFNLDGLFDLVVANAGDGMIAVFTGSGGGFSLSELLSDPNLTNPSALALADIDGVTQVLVTDAGEDGITVLDPKIRPSNMPITQSTTSSGGSGKVAVILAALFGGLLPSETDDQIQGSGGADELTEDLQELPSLGQFVTRWLRQVLTELQQELSKLLPDGSVLSSLLDGDDDSDSLLAQRLRSALRITFDAGLFPWVRLIQQATDVFSRLIPPPQAERREMPARSQTNFAPQDGRSSPADRQQTPQSKRLQRVTSQASGVASAPRSGGEVAGTFHVPSATFSLTAHGMCLLLSDEQSSINQVMIELATVPFVAASVFEGSRSIPCSPRLKQRTWRSSQRG